jgi:hypothetical protein
MEEAPENGKELSHSVRANGIMNERFVGYAVCIVSEVVCCLL